MNNICLAGWILLLNLAVSHCLADTSKKVSPLALPTSTKEKLQKMDFTDFVKDWTFFWNSQPIDVELDHSLHTVIDVDGDAYLSTTLVNDLNSGFRVFCAAHGGRIESVGHNFYPKRLNGSICTTDQTDFNGYVKFEIKREADFMFADVWFVPESDYIDSEEVASRKQEEYRFRWHKKGWR